MQWYVETYQVECMKHKINGGFQIKELELEQQFAPVAPGIHAITRPTTVVDNAGRIVCWILPDVLPKCLQVIYVLRRTALQLTIHRMILSLARKHYNDSLYVNL